MRTFFIHLLILLIIIIGCKEYSIKVIDSNKTPDDYIINISREDQRCLKDEDCTAILTSVCSQCECWGEPVNIIHKEKYQLLFREKEKLCDSIEQCEMDCQRECPLKCIDGFCTRLCN
jgi:hypothetical protein